MSGLYHKMSGLYHKMSGVYHKMSGLYHIMSGLYHKMSGLSLKFKKMSEVEISVGCKKYFTSYTYRLQHQTCLFASRIYAIFCK